MKHIKYPRTPHLPWSPGYTDDDVLLNDASHFVGREVVCLEKMDGENTSIYNDGTHARSLDSKDHPSRAYIKQIYGRIKQDIPADMKLCAENCFAVHSIRYKALPDWLLLFGIYQETQNGVICLSWDDTKTWSELLELCVVPELYRGVYDEEKIKACYTGQSKFQGAQEGYVIRAVESFDLDNFNQSIAKWVRPHHIQTDEHWTHKQIEINGRRTS